jgi:hypothetical protein
MTEAGGDDISRITDKDVHYENVRAFNAARQLIVGGMLILFAVTAIGAGLGAFFGSSARWNQLSPVVDTVLAIEAAALGSAIAFYMAKQD